MTTEMRVEDFLAYIARMPVPKFVCEVACASGFASYMDDDVSWDTRSYVRKARPNSIAHKKGNLGTHLRAIISDWDRIEKHLAKS